MVRSGLKRLPLYFHLITFFAAILLLLFICSVNVDKRYNEVYQNTFTRNIQEDAPTAIGKSLASRMVESFLGTEREIKKHHDINLTVLDEKLAHVHANHWQKAIGADSLFIYSAYYQHDKVRGKLAPVIRVIAIAKVGSLNKKFQKGLRCIYWTIGRNNITVIRSPIIGFTLLPESHSTKYRPVLVSCPVLDNKRPNYISIDSGNSPWITSINLLNVNYNSLATTKLRNFTMCLSPVHGAPVTPVNFVQYFELNSLLGAEYFLVYNYSMVDTGLLDVARYYQEKGVVGIIQWKLPEQIDQDVTQIWYFAQVAMLNDCYYSNQGLSRYIVTTDLDEFIVPYKLKNWHDFIRSVNPSCEYNIRSVALRGNVCNCKHHVCFSAKERNIMSSLVYPHDIRSKFILGTDCILSAVSIHTNVFPRKYKPEGKHGSKLRVAASQALVLHYSNATKIYGNIKQGKQTRILEQFMDKLERNVDFIVGDIPLSTDLSCNLAENDPIPFTNNTKPTLDD